MRWTLALKAPLGQDLSVFSRQLWAAEVAHRISEGDGGQQLWVADEQTAERVRQHYALFLQQPVQDLEFSPPPSTMQPAGSAGWQQLRRFPLTAFILLLTLAVAVWTGVGSALDNVIWLTFNAVVVDGQYARFLSLEDTLAAGQWWRLFSPMLIHFGWLHLAMNSLWYWELGRRIEMQQGSLFLLAFTLLSALVSNFSQFVFSGAAFFGGLSGVLYALLGFCWIRQRLSPVPAYNLPKGVVGMMLVWLLACLSGLVTALGFGQIANAAHVSGLIIGCAAGLVVGLLARHKAAA